MTKKDERPKDEHEETLVKAQWEKAKRDGLLDTHPDSLNTDRPKE